MFKENNKIIATIILYNPNFHRLEENIKSVSSQVSEILLVINEKCNKVLLQKLLDKFSSTIKIGIIENNKNMGIAYALNQSINYANEKGYKWVLTLDQDTVCPKGLVDSLSVHTNKERIGIIAPNFTDRNYFREEEEYTGWKYVPSCITSASLTNVDICLTIGGFDNDLFIDYVDYDYCARLISNGYAIILDYDVRILHEIGNGKKKYFGKYSMIIYNHPAFRKYYIIRNFRIFCSRYPDFPLSNKRSFLFRNFVGVVFFENDKINKLKSMFKGLIDSNKIILKEKKKRRIILDKRRNYVKSKSAKA